jgi:hypothetical protein
MEWERAYAWAKHAHEAASMTATAGPVVVACVSFVVLCFILYRTASVLWGVWWLLVDLGAMAVVGAIGLLTLRAACDFARASGPEWAALVPEWLTDRIYTDAAFAQSTAIAVVLHAVVVVRRLILEPRRRVGTRVGVDHSSSLSATASGARSPAAHVYDG